MAIKTQPSATCPQSALQRQHHEFTRAADFPEYAEPIFASGEAKLPAAFCANPARRNPQRLAWCDHSEFARRGDAAVGCASRTWCGESSWRGESIDRSVRIDANAFPNEVVLRTVVRGFVFQSQMTNSSTGAVHRHKMTWKPHQCLSFTLCLPRHSVQTCGQINRRVAPTPDAEADEPDKRGKHDESRVVGWEYLSGHARNGGQLKGQKQYPGHTVSGQCASGMSASDARDHRNRD